nr:collagen alpha-2(I) chain-like [Macaca fascicularis]
MWQSRRGRTGPGDAGSGGRGPSGRTRRAGILWHCRLHPSWPLGWSLNLVGPPTNRKSLGHVKVDPTQPPALPSAPQTPPSSEAAPRPCGRGPIWTPGSAGVAGSASLAATGRGGARFLPGLPNPLEEASASKWFESGPLVFSRSKKIEQLTSFVCKTSFLALDFCYKVTRA